MTRISLYILQCDKICERKYNYFWSKMKTVLIFSSKTADRRIVQKDDVCCRFYVVNFSMVVIMYEIRLEKNHIHIS